MTSCFVFLVLYGCFCKTILSQDNAPEIQTSRGPIRGRTLQLRGELIDEFFGVPFAQPPLGKLRFDKPKEIDSWVEVRDLPSYPEPAACPQPNQRIYHDEDCLYLNIWAPSISSRANSSNFLPILFFIHGGGFVYGSAMEAVFNSTAWTVFQDQIMVIPNYRLGAFGFLHANQSDAPGNLALWDQAAALKWTSDNAEAFGGDASKISIVGQSAGSASVGIHVTSPISRPLFQRAVMMSGSPFVNFLPEENIQRSKRLAGYLGCDASDLDNDWLSCMRSKTAQEILNVTHSYPYFHFGPNSDDEIYPIPAPKALTTGQFNGKDLNLLSGLAEDEGTYVVFLYCSRFSGFRRRGNPNETTKQSARDCIRNSIWHAIRDEAAEYYLKNVDGSDGAGLRKAAAKAVGDFIFTCPTYFYSNMFAKRLETGDVYSYHLSYATRYSYFCWDSDWPAICHGDELFTLFGDPFRRPWIYNASDIVYAGDLIDVWSNFTIKGKPWLRNSATSWPPYQQVPMSTSITGVTVAPMIERPTWPSYIELNPFKQLQVSYRPYKDCDNFWSRHMDIWMPDGQKSKIKYRKMEARGKKWQRRRFYVGDH